ncbi:MAG: hypothetical protein U0P30_03880 [Vicinamibacterales bacterium]
MTRRVLGAVVTTLVLTGVARAQTGEPGQTGVDERRNAAVTLVTGEIEHFTGQVDRHCGIFLLHGAPDGPPSVTRQQIQTALRCMQQAKRQGRPAWAVWQVAGVDATTFAGFASSRFSDLHLVDTGSAPEDLAFRPCLLPRVARDGAITCRNQPVDASSLAKALDHLHDDVARSFGRGVASEIDRTIAAAPVPASAATPDETLRQQVTRARTALRSATGSDWPMCPIHRTHVLELRDQQWFCTEDRAFVAPLGRLRKLRPARPLP